MGERLWAAADNGTELTRSAAADALTPILNGVDRAVGTASSRSVARSEESGRQILLRLIGIVVGLRVALQVVGMVSVSRYHSPWEYVLRLWVQWDAGHYLRIAEVGYRPVGAAGDDPLYIVFFPGYPLAVRIVSVVFRDLVASGLVVSAAAAVGCGWFLYKLVRLDGSHEEAWRAVILLYTFPLAFFLAAPYSEALFLLAILASVYAARTGRWWRSSLAGVAATASRLAGLALLPALAIEAIGSSDRWPVRLRRLVFAAAAGTGVGLYLLINLIVHEDPFHFLTVQRAHWFQHVVWPWQPIRDAVRELVQGGHDAEYTAIFVGRVGAFAFAVPMLVFAVRSLRRADAVYGWAGFALVLSASWLLSLPRYLLPLYPIFMVEAKLTRSRRVFRVVIILGFLVQCYLFWRYVGAEWAF